MPTIRFFDGEKYISVEVTEEFAAAYSDMENRESLVERKETRRHQSLDISLEHGFDVADPNVNIALEAELNSDAVMLRIAILKLPDRQQELIHRFYYKDEKLIDIALDWNVHKSTVSHLLKRAIKNLKKYLD